MVNPTALPPSRSSIDHDLLLAQSSWVEALARTLIRDPFGAEDVFQETMLAALEAPPRNASDVKRLRAWLGRVTFNLAHLSLRRSGRRRAREEDAAKSGVLDSTADQVARRAIFAEVSDSVRSLEEPYRSAVLKRYFEGKSTVQIARETSTSDNAVRKRLWRARAKLRGTLDRRHNGDRLAWFGALAPLIGIELPIGLAPAAPITSTATGSVSLASACKSIAASPLLWAGALVSAALLATTLRPTPVHLARGDSVDLAPIERAVVEGGTLRSANRQLVGALGDSRRLPDVPVSPETEKLERDDREETAEPLSEGPTAMPVRGRVVDLDGSPLSGLRIAIEGSEQPLGWSAIDGSFEVELSSLGHTLTASSEEHAPLRNSLVEEGNANAEHLLVAGRTIDIAGLVIDEQGGPLPGATLEVAITEAQYRNIESPLQLSSSVERTTATDEAGGFELARAICADGIFLRATHEGFEATSCEMPRESTAGLLLTLHRSPEIAARLEGVVYHESGEPAAKAHVQLGDDETWTDGKGHFAFSTGDVSPDDDLLAFKKGYVPARIPDIGARIRSGHLPQRQLGMELVLGGIALEISGDLIDEMGDPLSGWVVTATPALRASMAPPEDLLASTALEDPDLGEALLGSTMKTGGFVIPGLRDGEYILQAFDPESLLAIRSEVVTAGTEDLQLQLGENAWREKLEGRVVREDGLPLAGARVGVALLVQSGEISWWEHGIGAVTDLHGCFALPEIPRHGIALEVAHVEAIGATILLASDAPDRGHELALQSSGYARVEVAAGPRAPDHFIVLDGEGSVLPLEGLEAMRNDGRIYHGRSIPYRMSATAETLVLLRNGRVVRRVALEVEPGEITVVEAPIDLPSSESTGSAEGSL
jgi:RNA polymerase sigma factor (sigma-70 family)